MSIVENLIFLILLIPSAVLHEYAHGWVAYRCGDPTAKNAGRLTFNPLKHFDLKGAVLLPGVLLLLKILGVPIFILGAAKPVPVQFQRLRNPKRDMMLVGAAGPGANICLAVIISIFARLPLGELVLALIGFMVFINLLLALFNLIPVPPLDGSRLVMGVLPDRLAMKYAQIERFGLLPVFLLIYILFHFNVFQNVFLPLIESIMKFLGV